VQEVSWDRMMIVMIIIITKDYKKIVPRSLAVIDGRFEFCCVLNFSSVSLHQ
jgi:hypothetical protein